MEDKRTKAAAYLLKNYPVLWEQSHVMADDALYGRSGKEPGADRKAEGVHSDPTANRGIALYEAHSLADGLAQVRAWIDSRLPPENRILLIAIWRMISFGWGRVARETGRLGVGECQRTWGAMVENLAAQLNWNS